MDWNIQQRTEWGGKSDKAVRRKETSTRRRLTITTRPACERDKSSTAGKDVQTDNMPYKYETHLHTAESSKCGSHSGAEFARHYKSLGYTGIIVTDHFLADNTTVPQNLPWKERIEWFCRGFDAAAAEGEKIGLDVFFAWEHGFGWVHLLTYGLDKQWLLANPDMLEWNEVEYLDRVHAAGGGVVHAHPFRENVDIVRLIPEKVDAVEVLNQGRTDAANRHALDFAVSFDLPQTAGSDIHGVNQRKIAGIECSRRLQGSADYITALLAGDTTIFEFKRV